jgi:hypothetical protein
MPRRFLLLIAGLALAARLPAAARSDATNSSDEPQSGVATSDSDLTAARYPAASNGGYSYSYFDGSIVEPECTQAADPIGCSAQAGARVLDAAAAADTAAIQADADADARDPADPASDVFAGSDLALGTAAVAVRHVARGFNTRQEVDYLGDGTRTRFDKAIDKIAGTGVSVHRLAIYWWDVQCSGNDQWNWTRYDTVVDALNAKNIRVILTPTGSPNWARNANRQTPTVEGDSCRPAKVLGPFAHGDNLAAWQTFIRELASHSTAMGWNPIGYEIWNEENSREFWDATGSDTPTYQAPSPSGWAHLYCRAASEIDLHDSGRLVGVGGLAVHRANKNDSNGRLQNIRTKTFLRQAYAARRSFCPGKPFDFVGYHPYAFAKYYSGRNPNLVNTPAMLELVEVRKVMRANGQGARRVWNTEWGFPSDFRGISKARQASLIKREHEYLARLHEGSFYYMRFSILFNPIDSKPAGPNDVFAHVGVVAVAAGDEDNPNEWANKPSYATWKAQP